MGNLTLATLAMSQAATLSASSEVSAMPVNYLQRPQPTDKWRTDDLNNIHIVADLGGSKKLNQIALLYHNASSAAQWRIRAAESEGDLTASPKYDSGSVDMWHEDWPENQSPLHALHWLDDTPITARWVRIDIDDADNPAGYVQAGVLLIDNAWQAPTQKNISYGWQIQHLDLWRGISFSLDWLNEDEMYNNIYELQRYCRHMDIAGAATRSHGGQLYTDASVQPVFVVRDPDAETHLLRQSIYGMLSQIQPIIHAQQQIFRTRVTIEEML